MIVDYEENFKISWLFSQTETSQTELLLRRFRAKHKKG